jgi:integrase
VAAPSEDGAPRRPQGRARRAALAPRLDRFGSAEDGRLFRTSKGAAFTSSAYYRVWRVARSYAFTPEQLASPLAGRPYDLRHAAVSLWLNPGVPAQEVADRVGHSVDVLWKVYAGTIDGDEARLNRMIELALAAFSW